MSLVNLELENKIIEITKKICDPNCKKCKLSLVTNLENRAKFSNFNKKRNLDELNNYDTYYDVIEYNSEYLPKKYRKYTYEQHRTSQFSNKSNDSQSSSKFYNEKSSDKHKKPFLENLKDKLKWTKDHEESNKRKVEDSEFQKDAELYLENVKKRVLESNKSKKSDTTKKDEDPEYEKFLEQRYYGFLKNVDKSTLVDFVDVQTQSGVLKDTVSTDFSTQKLFVGDSSSPKKIELSPTPEVVSLPLQTTPETQTEVTKTLEPTTQLTEEKEPLSTEEVKLVPSPIGTPKESEDKGETPKSLELTSDTPSEDTKTTTSLFGTTNESIVKNLFSTDTKPVSGSDKSKELFSSLDKIKVDKPVGNPLFAPNRQSSSEFIPKTDGANYVFGQSRPQADKPTGSSATLGFGGLQSQQPLQDTSLYNQLASSGYGTPLVQQQNPTIFGPGSFKKAKFRGRGRGRH